MVAYRPGVDKARQGALLFCSGIAFTALSVVATIALGSLMLEIGEGATFFVGDVLPSLLIALGFFPQFYEFFATWSVEGYAFGVTFFDVTGSVGNTIVLFAHAGTHLAHAAFAAIPFFTIIALHAVLLAIAAVILCSQAAPAPKLPREDSQVDTVLRSFSRSLRSASSASLEEGLDGYRKI